MSPRRPAASPAEPFLALLRSPTTGGPLTWAEPYVLTDGESLWPCLDGIPYLRTGRDRLRARTIDAIRAGDLDRALALLLCDRKDDTVPAADPVSALAVAAGATTAKAAMDGLGYGGLAPYFLHRWCQPTYLSGLALLDAHVPTGATLFEIGCGAGHLLRTWTDRSGPAIGSDLVFSHLWLARTFCAPTAHLVCFDAEGAFPLADGAAGAALSHDSFHYFRDKQHVLAELLRVSGTGPVLLGHVHNASRDNYSAGHPLPTDAYLAALSPDRCYDDEVLTDAALQERTPAPVRGEELRDAAALAFACRTSGDAAVPGRLTGVVPGRPLRLNPLLTDTGPRWPDEKFAREFTDGWPYLRDLTRPPRATLAAGRAGLAGSDPDVDSFARRRVLLDLPESWL
ncbi:methyltransferase domain-containing protein (plasmid) [Streptomyces sp. NBC_01278]|uniref:methyltransferase domain-containing protein n=1 Tax=Streptomyces sp. NBC_01278 TaxID=2903809 RepID=UPI002E35C800|nr:methyltransferase domain-containing protein [Streptomyces sp. NBC_01278]